MDTLTRGARGGSVLDVQTRLGSLGYRVDPTEHGFFGPSTERAVREFQQRRRLMVDGVVGAETWDELVEAGYSLGDRVLYLRYPHYRGDDVRLLQASLNLLGFDAGREDGLLGQRTDRAVQEFQRNVGLPSDGIVGATTVEALRRLRPVGPGPGRAAVREAEALSRLSASLRGARIAVDAGHGHGDPGVSGPNGLTEAEIAYQTAAALVDELSVRGASPFLLRTTETNPTHSERASAANAAGAEVLIAVHLNSHDDPAAEGASTYYYGREDWFSQAGQRLAELVQNELTARLGLKDGRTHPKALTLLRETQMPAVHVEPCFITNPREEALISQDGFRREVARGMADAIERFLRGEGARLSSAAESG
ncbi:MAG: N-acetylmuramoyl-L-alanine amidase [Actinomycetota bacterium]